MIKLRTYSIFNHIWTQILTPKFRTYGNPSQMHLQDTTLVFGPETFKVKTKMYRYAKIKFLIAQTR